MKRARNQLVVNLGDGDKGLRLRRIIHQRAAAAGQLDSVWARKVLIEDETDPTLASKVKDIERRLSALERDTRDTRCHHSHARQFQVTHRYSYQWCPECGAIRSWDPYEGDTAPGAEWDIPLVRR